MKDPAVIDAYLGSHQDVDLGVVTGRVAGELTEEGLKLAAEVERIDDALDASDIGDVDIDTQEEKD
jgi:branched-chain amino acid transport system ATP-binding protein